MRIELVAAYAFGPFVGETLRLAPGMTVIWGRNEAGKSSWHAALYFGLCGRRRGSGQPSREERVLRARHEPWDGGRWEVGATLSLPKCAIARSIKIKAIKSARTSESFRNHQMDDNPPIGGHFDYLPGIDLSLIHI